jgi:hypothetical protein
VVVVAVQPAAQQAPVAQAPAVLTEADYEELSRAEWLGSLYVDEDNHVIIPGDNVEAMLVEVMLPSPIRTQVLMT